LEDGFKKGVGLKTIGRGISMEGKNPEAMATTNKCHQCFSKNVKEEVECIENVVKGK
jgi:hypothetical protein